MKEIRCENPRFILAPHAAYLLCLYGHYCLLGKNHTLTVGERALWQYDFPYKQFAPKSLGISYENIDSCYIYSEDGECIPLYMPVPCGHCTCCRERKRNEWACRAICEAQSHNSVPWFITLTYAPQNYPSCGVCKEDVQKFLKRFRINCKRDGIDLSDKFRYFLVSEYGKNTHRGHYHAIFYGIEGFKNKSALLHAIEDAWSLGFVMIRPCDAGGVYYTMKYMRKEGVVPEGKNEPFFLSSRRHGGLGAMYCNEVLLPQFRKDPSLLTFKVNDKFSGKVQEFSLPQYFSDKIFPTYGKLIPKEVRDGFGKLVFLTMTQCAMVRACGNSFPLDGYLSLIYDRFPQIKHVNPMSLTVVRHGVRYEGKGFLGEFVPYTEEENVTCRVPDYISAVARLEEPAKDFFNARFKEIIDECHKLEKYLGDNMPAADYVDTMLSLREVHKEALITFMDKLEQIPLSDYVNKIKNRNAKAKEREIL